MPETKVLWLPDGAGNQLPVEFEQLESGNYAIKASATVEVEPAEGAATEDKQDTGNTSLASIATKIGEVQASPTANTLLDRVKALLTGIVLAAGSARIGKVTVRNAADAADIDPLAEATFTGRVGEVQASPTANTVLDRRKALLTGITLAAGTNMIGAVLLGADSTVATGELDGSTSADQCPTVACKLARFKARANNTGNVYIGVSGVTKPDGTTDATTGFELAAGEDTGWLPTDNLSRFYYITDGASDEVLYMVMS